MQNNFRIFALLLICSWQMNYAQSNRTLRIVTLHGDTAIPEMYFEIPTHGRHNTNSEGMLDLLVDESTHSLKLNKLNYDNLVFYSPEGGMLNIDETQVYKIIFINQDLSAAKDLVSRWLEKEFERKNRWYELKQESYVSAFSETLQKRNSALYDSIYKMGMRKTELEVIATVERNKYRASKVGPLFNDVLDLLISRANDVRDAFQEFGDKVFYRPEIVAYLNRKQDGYNDAYERLLSKKDSILINVNNYWDFEDSYLVKDFIENQTLNQFHESFMLPKNSEVIKDITTYNTRIKGRKKRSEIQTEIDVFINLLNTQVCELSNKKVRIGEILTKLY